MAQVYRDCWIICFGSRLLHPQIDGVIIGSEAEAQKWCTKMESQTGIPFWYESSCILDGMQNWVDNDKRYYVPHIALQDAEDDDE